MKGNMLHLDKRPGNADVWTAKLHVMKTDSEPVLTVTDLTGWFQEAVEQERVRVQDNIFKTETGAMKKKSKYERKVDKLQSKLVKNDMDAKDFAKASEKEQHSVTSKDCVKRRPNTNSGWKSCKSKSRSWSTCATYKHNNKKIWPQRLEMACRLEMAYRHEEF